MRKLSEKDSRHAVTVLVICTVAGLIEKAKIRKYFAS